MSGDFGGKSSSPQDKDESLKCRLNTCLVHCINCVS